MPDSLFGPEAKACGRLCGELETEPTIERFPFIPHRRSFVKLFDDADARKRDSCRPGEVWNGSVVRVR